MDIAAVSIGMHQDSVPQAVEIALIKKAMGTDEENSQSLVKMMELSVNPNLGSNLDVTA